MEPEQSAAGPSGNSYDFIVKPPDAPKRKFNLAFAGNSFIGRVVVVLGGAVVLMIVAAVTVNLLFGGRNNIGLLLILTQNEQEIVRVGALGKNASDPDIKNAAINTTLSVKSQQQAWLDFIAKRGRSVKPEELSLKKDASTDSRLEAAEQTSTFDSTYTSVMRSLLEDYSNELKTIFDGTTSQQQRVLLSTHYNEVELLLKQWPSSTLGLAYY